MKLKNYLKKFKYHYLLGSICMLLAIVLDLMSPFLTRRIIDDVILDGKTQILMSLLLGLLGIGFGRAVLGYVKEFTFDWIGTTAANQMRKDVFDHVQTLSVDFFHRHNTGELMTRIKDDVDKVCSAIDAGEYTLSTENGVTSLAFASGDTVYTVCCDENGTLTGAKVGENGKTYEFTFIN